MPGNNRLLLPIVLFFMAMSVFAEGKPAPAGSEAETVPGKAILTVRKNQRMLVVSVAGDPCKVGNKAFRTLLGIYFRGATEAEKNAPILPRVRWVLSTLDAQRRDWIGNYALPVSDAFPVSRSGEVRIEDWHYGMVAEVLHAGPFNAEPRTLATLMDFIAKSGFAVSGDLEEEFPQGTEPFTRRDSQAFRSLLRIPVEGIQDFPKSYIPLSSLP